MGILDLIRRRWWLFAAVLLVGGVAFYSRFAGITLHGEVNDSDALSQPLYRTVACFGYVDLQEKIRLLNPTVPGRVAEVLVREGDHVAAGTVLLRLENAQANKTVEQAQAALDNARMALEQGRSLPEEHRIQLAQAQRAITVAKADRDRAEAELKHMQELVRENQRHPRDLTNAQLVLTAADEVVRVKEDDLRRLGLKDPQYDVKNLEFMVARADTQLEQAKLALNEFAVVAPTAGTVQQITVNRGDTLNATTLQPTIEFHPDGPQVIRAEVEQAFAALVVEGLDAKIEDETHAAGAWTGRVKRVSDRFTQRRPSVNEPLQLNDVRMMACTIELDPGQKKLRIGQRVLVTLQVPSR